MLRLKLNHVSKRATEGDEEHQMHSSADVCNT